MPNTLNLFLCAASAIALASATSIAQAQPYPSKPIRLIVPLAPGSTADIASRFTANELGKALGQTVVVENKTGAGSIAMAELARSAADGYTIGFASQGTLVFNQGIYAKPGYDSTKDFAPIALLGGVSNVMIVHPTNKAGAPADNWVKVQGKTGRIDVFVRRSRHESSPVGRSVRARHGNSARARALQGRSARHIGGDGERSDDGIFQRADGHQPNQGGQPQGARRHQPCALPATAKRADARQQGVKGYEVNTWFGFVAPAGTPPEVVNRLNAELNKIFTSAEAKEKLAPQGFDLSPPLTPAAFGKLIANDLTRWVPIVRASGAKAD